MCLGVPGLITSLYDDEGLPMGKVSFGGVQRPVCLAHIDEPQVGQWVLVHVGFALSRIDEEEAQKIFALLEELSPEEVPSAPPPPSWPAHIRAPAGSPPPATRRGRIP